MHVVMHSGVQQLPGMQHALMHPQSPVQQVHVAVAARPLQLLYTL